MRSRSTTIDEDAAELLKLARWWKPAYTATDNDESNWRKDHAILIPIFSKTAMQRYHDKMAVTVHELLDAWDKKLLSEA